MDLKHKVAIVSVASAGIGRELAREFTRHEARVVCAARREQVLNFDLIAQNLQRIKQEDLLTLHYKRLTE